MGRGGSRKHPEGCDCGNCPKVGRPKVKAEQAPKVGKDITDDILAMKKRRQHAANCKCEDCHWWTLLHYQDLRLQFDARKYLTDKRDGQPMRNVNHIHDKPIEMNVTQS